MITINPVNWGFHEHPVDCWRMYPDGMKALYEDAGLEMEFAKAEGLEPLITKRRVKWIIKQLIRRPTRGEPYYPIDNISIGRRVGAPPSH